MKRAWSEVPWSIEVDNETQLVELLNAPPSFLMYVATRFKTSDYWQMAMTLQVKFLKNCSFYATVTGQAAIP